MIYNEDTYYIGYHRTVREIGALPALVFSTICGLLRENGIGEISNSTLCDLFGITPAGLRKIVAKLIECGYLEKRNGDGRGNKSIYYITEKGKQNYPFMVEKGETKLPKRGNNVSIKGKQSYPINKELNKELNKESGETPTPLVMEKDFLEFWDLYPDSANFEYDKEHCANVWDRIDPEWQQKLLQQLRMGLLWRKKQNDKPYYYLLDYKGQDVQVELPIMHQGTVKFTRWIQEAQKNNEQVCLMWEMNGDERKIVYCLERDRQVCEAAGLVFCRNF